jgi:glycerophosphoryl diester phosphodiesterase
MKISAFQPPYPREGTPAAAERCLGWMSAQLESIEPGDSDLILLPEYANAPGLADAEGIRTFAAGPGQRFLRCVAAHAKRLNCLIGLSAAWRAGERWSDRALLFGPDEEIAFHYDKVHLTDVEEEELGLSAGTEPCVFEHDGVRIAFAVCFDLYFPEYFAVLTEKGVDLILCPSYQRSETEARICLGAQARALDTGAHLVRSSYAMSDEATGGHSLVASPKGVLLADAGTAPGVVSAEFDPTQGLVRPASHGQSPVDYRAMLVSHRRPQAYLAHQAKITAPARPFPRLCAHRGLSEACPENTLPAFAAALSVGADEIEFDLSLSRDGVAVVCHDDSFDRTTDGEGRIAEMDWAEICRLDAGIKCGEAWQGVRVPRFEEALDLTDARIGLNVHLKPGERSDELVTLVCDTLRERALLPLAYIAGHTEPVLQIAREYAPEVQTACLVDQGDPDHQIQLSKEYGCQRIQFGRAATAGQIAMARESGLICNLFWSDEIADAVEYVRKGIDVILTNRAHTLIADGFLQA